MNVIVLAVYNLLLLSRNKYFFPNINSKKYALGRDMFFMKPFSWLQAAILSAKFVRSNPKYSLSLF